MKTVLFCMALKPGTLEQYLAFAKKTIERGKEYRDLLTRYDIHCAKIWHKKISDRDYIFVYHEVGPNFEEKMKGWPTSEHPFDKWFNENIMAVYDIEDIHGMEQPTQVLNI